MKKIQNQVHRLDENEDANEYADGDEYEDEEEYEHDKQKLWRRHLRLREILCQLSGSAIITVPGIPITPGIRKYRKLSYI